MKARLTALFLAALLLLLPACGGRFVPSASSPPPGPRASVPASRPPESSPPPEDTPPPPLSPAEYHTLASAFQDELMEQSELLFRMGLYEYNWWGGYDGDPAGADLNALLEEVNAWLSDAFQTGPEDLSDALDRLTRSYAALIRADVDSEVPPDAAAQAEALFAAYRQLYATVTQPSGTVQGFVRMLASCAHSIDQASEGLTAALEAALVTL